MTDTTELSGAVERLKVALKPILSHYKHMIVDPVETATRMDPVEKALSDLTEAIENLNKPTWETTYETSEL